MGADGAYQPNLTNNSANEFQPAWSPDGKQIAFESSRDGNVEVYTMTASGRKQRRLTRRPLGSDGEPAWSPDGKRIAFTHAQNGNQDIFTMNADGSDQSNRTKSGENDSTPDWQPRRRA
jgi:Tol biopolymer transport system component